jgi:hypothetical protein
MRFGIPFTRPFTSPFGAPFPGSRRQTPTDYVAKYSAFNPNDFSLVTGNSVNIWDDKTGANDLTQGTSANQPSLIQNANPALNKVEFGPNDFTNGLPPQSGDFSYVFNGLNLPTDTGSSRVFLSNPSAVNVLFYVVGSSDKFAIRDSTNTIHQFDKTFDYGVDQDVDLTRSGTLYSLYVDGVLEDSITVASVNQAFTSLGREITSLNGSLQELEVFDRALSEQEIKSYGGA